MSFKASADDGVAIALHLLQLLQLNNVRVASTLYNQPPVKHDNLLCTQ